MAINKQRKQDLLKLYDIEISNSECIFFINTNGLNVITIDNLRNSLSEFEGAKYKLIKNTLFKKSLKELKFTDDVIDSISGYNAVIFAHKDSNLLAKLIIKFCEDNSVNVNFAILDKQKLLVDDVVKLSNIKSKEVLVLNMIYILKDGINNVVHSLNYNTNLLVNTLDLIENKRG